MLPLKSKLDPSHAVIVRTELPGEKVALNQKLSATGQKREIPPAER
jgi:hypothetical protein